MRKFLCPLARNLGRPAHSSRTVCNTENLPILHEHGHVAERMKLRRYPASLASAEHHLEYTHPAHATQGCRSPRMPSKRKHPGRSGRSASALPRTPSTSPGQVKCMTPTELKAALQRTFDMRLSPAQLGAVAHLFGTGDDAADSDACDGGTYCHRVVLAPVHGRRFYRYSCPNVFVFLGAS